MVVGVKTRLKRQQSEIHINIPLVLYRVTLLEGRKRVKFPFKRRVIVSSYKL